MGLHKADVIALFFQKGVRMLVDRRTFMVSCAASFIDLACSDHAKHIRLDPLIPQEVRDYVVSHNLNRSNEGSNVLLLHFLAEASSNSSLDGRLPLIFKSDTPNLELDRLGADRQLQILKGGHYKEFELEPGRSVLICMTSQFIIEGHNKDAALYFSRTVQYLPLIESFVSTTFRSTWLHVELHTSGRTHYTDGFNVLLSEVGNSSASAYVHELTHTYNSIVARTMPIFITEGLAELTALIVTGDAILGSYQPTQLVHLNKMYDYTPIVLLNESVSGLAFFRNVLEAIGIDSLSKAIGQMFAANVSDGLSALSIIKSYSPNRDAIERLFRSWIVDYLPNSA